MYIYFIYYFLSFDEEFIASFEPSDIDKEMYPSEYLVLQSIERQFQYLESNNCINEPWHDRRLLMVSYYAWYVFELHGLHPYLMKMLFINNFILLVELRRVLPQSTVSLIYMYLCSFLIYPYNLGPADNLIIAE